MFSSLSKLDSVKVEEYTIGASIPEEITDENCHQKLYDFFNAPQDQQHYLRRKADVARELLNVAMHSDEEAKKLIEQIKLYLNFQLHYLNKDIKSKDSVEINPLSTAVRSGFCELVCALVDLGVHPDEPISDTHTLLSLATLHWRITDITKILAHPQYQPTVHISRAIYYAASNNYTEIAKALIMCAKKAGLFDKKPTLLNNYHFNHTWNIALHETVQNSDIRLIKLLLENGADLFQKNKKKMTSLEMAEKINNPAVLKVLASYGYIYQYKYGKWYLKLASIIIEKHLEGIIVAQEDIDTIFYCLGRYIDNDSIFATEELSTAIYFLEHLERSLAKVECEFKILSGRVDDRLDLYEIAQYIIPCFFVAHKMNSERRVWNEDFLTSEIIELLPRINLIILKVWEFLHLKRLGNRLHFELIDPAKKTDKSYQTTIDQYFELIDPAKKTDKSHQTTIDRFLVAPPTDVHAQHETEADSNAHAKPQKMPRRETTAFNSPEITVEQFLARMRSIAHDNSIKRFPVKPLTTVQKTGKNRHTQAKHKKMTDGETNTHASYQTTIVRFLKQPPRIIYREPIIEAFLIKHLTTAQVKIGFINDEAALHPFFPDNLLSPLAIRFKKKLLDGKKRKALRSCGKSIEKKLLEWLSIAGIKKYLALEEKPQEQFNRIPCQKKFLLFDRCDSNAIRTFINLEETQFTPFDEQVEILRSILLEAVCEKRCNSRIEEITQELRILVDSFREIIIDLLCSENINQRLEKKAKSCRIAFKKQMACYSEIKFNNNNVYQELSKITEIMHTIWNAMLDIAAGVYQKEQKQAKENSDPGRHGLFHRSCPGKIKVGPENSPSSFTSSTQSPKPMRKTRMTI